MSHAVAQTSDLDLQAAEAFAGKIAEIVNSGAIAVMISIGHKTCLFDRMAIMPASTSQRIADAAGLNERYVREWLAAMVTGGIVNYFPESQSYTLPCEHAASLTRDAALGNLAVYAQFVPMAGSTQDRIIECFSSGEGTRYEDYPCFHAIMAEDTAQTVVAPLMDTVLPLVPGLRKRLEDGISVLDAGCGSGAALVALAKAFPNSRFTGYDLCADAI
ncbi:MAG: transcriptional regulator, partial [Hyphomicrobiales bacterium]|nr:transcriptional regulator [Hyphomicrobiales bacterium]